MTFETLLTTLYPQGVFVVTLNRPLQLNRMNPAFFKEIASVFRMAEADPLVRCILLAANGRAFSAGLDLAEAQGMFVRDDDEAQGAFFREILALQSVFTAVEECIKPVVVAVHGACVGGGVDLALACDVVLCSADATFSIRETQMAMVADLGSLHRLVRSVGRPWAGYLALTGENITAEQALRAGLVSHVLPSRDELLVEAMRVAGVIAANSPLAVQGAKRVMAFSREHAPKDALDYVALWNANFLHTPDLQEAMQAFFEKRKPMFKSRL